MELTFGPFGPGADTGWDVNGAIAQSLKKLLTKPHGI